MKKALIVIAVIIILGAVAYFVFTKINKNKEEAPVAQTTVKITSSAFQEGEEIPVKFSCRGENVNPDLKISGVPSDAKSLAIILDDPDAPAGVWTHVILANIDPTTNEIPENSAPQGTVIGKNSSGETKYDGPCPPSGTHRYYFKVFALESMLDLQNGFSRSELEEAMEGHILAQGQMMGKFSK